MKRFYCEICKRVKRVRQLPRNTVENLNAHEAKAHHIGTCRWHEDQRKGKK